MSIRTSVVVAACGGAVWCGACVADVVTVQPSQDTTIFESATGALANGAGEHMFVGQTSRTGSLRRGLLAFDVSSIPAGSTINSVSLQLWMSMTSSGASTISAHRVTADWGEGASDAGSPGGNGAPAEAGDATWLHTFFATSLWATPGGDFVGAASDSTSVDQTNFYTWSGAGMVADVQAWVDGTAGNFGWILVGNEASLGTAKRFGTVDSTDPGARPVLTIDYTPIPGPAGAAAFGVAAALVGARRRR